MKEPTIDEIWNVIESYGIKRETFENSNPSEETLIQMYHMIRESRRKRREQQQIDILKEWIRRMPYCKTP